MEEKLIRIEGPKFVAGVVLEDGHVVRAAPIVSYMAQWGERHVRRYCESKGWTVADNTAEIKLEQIRWMLSDPDWGVGMLEDIAAIVAPIPDNPNDEPRWSRH